jgi:hypothetical protein
VKVANSGGTNPSQPAILTVNRPPTAQDNGAATKENRALRITHGKLLDNDSDPDGIR